MEIWKSIAGYEGLYEVSSEGRVKYLSRVYIAGKGQKKVLSETIMSFSKLKKKPYLRVGLRKNKSYKMYLVHRLVAQSFIPNPENKPEVNHKDGNVMNNSLSNLEWVTKSENILHGFNFLKTYNNKGKNNPIAKTIVCTISGKEFGCIEEISKITGFKRDYIQRRLSNKVKNNLNFKYKQ